MRGNNDKQDDELCEERLSRKEDEIEGEKEKRVKKKGQNGCSEKHTHTTGF